MKSIVINGNDYARLADGRLKNMADWSPDAAIALAAEDNITLSDAHWDIINVMRDFYSTYNISPIRKLLKKEVARKHGADAASDEHLDSLFPNGINQATRYAGLPVPLMDSERDTTAQIKPASTSAGSHFSHEFDFNGKTVKVYPIGNLVNLDDWNEELAVYMAEREGIALGKKHWEVIRYLRAFYFRYGITPMVRLLGKHIREETGNMKITDESLYDLFPKGPSRQGSRIAGLPEPQGCIDN